MNKYMDKIIATDAHVAGEPIRLISSEQLNLKGDTVYEKREYFKENFDYLRKSLIHEPRGHDNMFGAVMCTTSNPEADVGLFFMDTNGYLDMCGHGIIGSVTIIWEQNYIINKAGENNHLIIETPGGLIKVKLKILNEKVEEVSFTNVPAFVYASNYEINTSFLGKLNIDIVYSGNFFALVKAHQLPYEMNKQNLKKLVTDGMKIKEILNSSFKLHHPLEKHRKNIDLVQFYDINRSNEINNCVVFGKGQVDRSPCGTGFSGVMALMHHKNLIKINSLITCKSILGTSFIGRITEKIKIENLDAVIPEIRGKAFITGTHEFILNKKDPFRNGFLI
ncbi:MAG: proline racemase family protein [Dethiosulfatibacter sp.]|nr:proline racemase family protein [Dethiosulfatibacter sp.]